MTRRRARGRIAAAALAATLVASAARADTASRAETLFQEARALVERGQYAEACPKLEESQALDPAVGTQFNLGDCYEHVGRSASAYRTFQTVATIARAAGKFEREKAARERAAALEPKLARVRFAVASEAPGEQIAIDRAPAPKESWAQPTPVDPGRHEIVASAPSRRAWRSSFEAREGNTTDVAVPALFDPTPKARPIAVERTPPQRTVALVAFGAGAAAIVTGTVAGAIALSNRSRAERECPKDVYDFKCPTTDGADAWNAAKGAGTVSTIAFVAGGALAAAGAVLWFTTPRVRVGASPSALHVAATF